MIRDLLLENKNDFIFKQLNGYPEKLISKLYEDQEWMGGISFKIPEASKEFISIADLILQYLKIPKEDWNTKIRIIKY
jgi:predicted nucleic acid-binding protein